MDEGDDASERGEGAGVHGAGGAHGGKAARWPTSRGGGIGAAVVSIVVAGAWALRRLRRLRRWQLRWGATEEEQVATLPGDGFVPAADLVATRAITVDAPADRVWPWIAQLGQGRGGFYSYDLLENLVGCKIQSADSVVDEWQDVRVGDAVHLHPEVALEVVTVEPDRALVLRGAVPVAGAAAANARAAGGRSTERGRAVAAATTAGNAAGNAARNAAGNGAGNGAGNAAADAPYDFSWAFVLSEQEGGTRLVVRERYGYLRPSAAALVEPVACVSFVMTQRMLRGIRDRAEATSGDTQPDR